MPTNDLTEQLANGDGVCLVGPAGCGKTEEIVKAAQAAPGRQLILTHTHAGVASLRSRLKKIGVSYSKVEVDTIAGWALKYTLAFPKLSGVTTKMPVGDQWNPIYGAMGELLSNRHICQVIKNSYEGLFVDEYQDCTITQHKLVLSIADIIPTRVIGDPLQGIFGFSGPVVDFDKDVFPRFNRLPDLDVPHRWRNDGNPKLGAWLLSIRSVIENGEALDLSSSPVQWFKADDSQRINTCRKLARATAGESVIAIRKWPNGCRREAKNMAGCYVSIEEMDCKDWMEVGEKLDTTSGAQQAKKLLEAIDSCVHQPKTPSRIAPIIRALGRGNVLSLAICCNSNDLLTQTSEFVSTGSPAAALGMLNAIAALPGLVVYRRDFWDEMRATFRRMSSLGGTSFAKTAWDCRANTRSRGRNLPLRVISTTLLVKGLECDHVIIWDANELIGDRFGRNNLYVAMTRGRKSLTIFSHSPQIILA